MALEIEGSNPFAHPIDPNYGIIWAILCLKGELIVKISPKEFNTTLNPTARGYVSGADGSTGFGKLPMDSPYLSPLLSTGSFAPYITSIQLYDKQGEEPIVVGNLPRPVQVRDDMHLVFRIRLDQ